MLIFLYGPDAYRRDTKKREYIKLFREKHPDAPIEALDCEEKDALLKLASFSAAQSMFSKKRLVSLEDLFETEDEKGFAKLLKQIAKSEDVTTLITSEKKPTKQWQFLVHDAHTATLFDELSGVKLERFIADEAKARGIELHDPAAALIGEVYQGDTWRLVTELDKLSLLGKTRISAEDVAHLSLELAPDFWGMINGLKSPSQKMRLRTLETILAQNEPAAKIFNIAAYSIPGALAQFAAYDGAIKSGKMDYDEALADAAL